MSQSASGLQSSTLELQLLNQMSASYCTDEACIAAANDLKLPRMSTKALSWRWMHILKSFVSTVIWCISWCTRYAISFLHRLREK